VTLKIPVLLLYDFHYGRVSEVDQSGPPHEEGDDGMELSQVDKTGVAISCFILARCLELGLGLDANPEKATEYYSKVST